MARKIEEALFDVYADVGTVTELPNGDAKCVKIISWNGHKKKMDIRTWDETRTIPKHGMPLDDTELNKLISLYIRWRAGHREIDTTSPVKVARMHTIYELIGELSGYNRGFRKELTVSSWMDGDPKLDLRGWDKAHSRGGKGISFSVSEMDECVRLLLWWRDESKPLTLRKSEKISDNPKAVRYTYKCGGGNEAGEQLAVLVKREGKGLEANVIEFAGQDCENLKALIPKDIEEKALDQAKADCLAGKEAVMPKKKVSSEDIKRAETFGKRVKLCRENAGLSRSALARKIGVSSSTIFNWEEGKTVPAKAGVDKVAHAFEVYAQWLRTGTGPINLSDEDAYRIRQRKKTEPPKTVRRTPKEETTGYRIMVAREAAGLTQKALAEMVGLKCGNDISVLELEKVKPSREKLELIAPHLKVTADWLETGKDVNPVEAAPEPAKAEPVAAEAVFAPITVAKPALPPEARLEGQIKLVNDCIYKLAAGNNSADVRNMHRFLAKLRGELEERLFFGTSTSAQSREWSEEDEAEIRAINDFVFMLKGSEMPRESVDDLYCLLQDKRFELETKMLWEVN